MYAVVYKNRVIVGPMEWNRAIFQGSLEKEKVFVTLPRIAPEELPYIVNEDVKIMIVEENRPQINPMVEYHYGPLWNITEIKVIANYEIRDTQIEWAKINFKNKVAEERWKKEIKGFTINLQNNEIFIDTNRENRNVFIEKFLTMSENTTINWKFSETWLVLTKQEIQTIISSCNSYIQSCFDWEKNINEQIEQTTTKEELLAIEIN